MSNERTAPGGNAGTRRLRVWLMAVCATAWGWGCQTDQGPIQEPAGSVTVHGVIVGPGPGGVPGRVTVASLDLGCHMVEWQTEVPIDVGGGYATLLFGPPGQSGFMCVRVQVPGTAQPGAVVTAERDSVFFGDARTDSVRIDVSR